LTFKAVLGDPGGDNGLCNVTTEMILCGFIMVSTFLPLALVLFPHSLYLKSYDNRLRDGSKRFSYLQTCQKSSNHTSRVHLSAITVMLMVHPHHYESRFQHFSPMCTSACAWPQTKAQLLHSNGQRRHPYQLCLRSKPEKKPDAESRKCFSAAGQ
jgi:hypothetical protein